MKAIRDILLVHILVIVMSHLAVPHLHHGEMTSNEHQLSHEEANSIIDYLSLAFQQDSYNTLENYVYSNSFPEKCKFYALPTYAELKFSGRRLIPEEKVRFFNTPFRSSVELLPSGLRAPPQV